MKKINPENHDNDINLSELLKIIWDGKIKIALITVIISAILFGYNHNKPKKPNVFYNTLDISSSKEEEFSSFLPVYSYLGTNMSNKNLLDEFIKEFLDYEELIIVLKNVEDIKEKLSQLSEQEQEQMLYNYARLFNIKEAKDFYEKGNVRATNNYVLEFTWGYENEQSRSILDRALKLTLNSLERSIFLKLENDYKITKDKVINIDLERIAYLSEQSLIAKELNLEGSKVDFYNLSEVKTSFNFNSSGTSPYYLRGYKAIDMEINVIENRKYPVLTNMEQKINLLKKKEFRWVDYNIYLLDVKLKNYNKTLSPVVVILFSVLFGAIYVLISDKIKIYKRSK